MAVRYDPFGGRQTYANDFERMDQQTRLANQQAANQSAVQAAMMAMQQRELDDRTAGRQAGIDANLESQARAQAHAASMADLGHQRSLESMDYGNNLRLNDPKYQMEMREREAENARRDALIADPTALPEDLRALVPLLGAGAEFSPVLTAMMAMKRDQARADERAAAAKVADDREVAQTQAASADPAIAARGVSDVAKLTGREVDDFVSEQGQDQLAAQLLGSIAPMIETARRSNNPEELLKARLIATEKAKQLGLDPDILENVFDVGYDQTQVEADLSDELIGVSPLRDSAGTTASNWLRQLGPVGPAYNAVRNYVPWNRAVADWMGAPEQIRLWGE